MKSWIKNLCVLPVFFLLVACNGKLTAPTSIPTETITATEEAIPSPSPEALDLSYLKQKFIQHAVLLNPNWQQMALEDKKNALKTIVHAWRKTMDDVNPDTMEYNLENVNRFLQFVRLSQGDEFQGLLKKTAQVNMFTHSLYRRALLEHNDTLLGEFMGHALEMVDAATKFKTHILEVAVIYGVKFEQTQLPLAVVKPLIDEVVEPIHDVFGVPILLPEDPFVARMTELYQGTTLGIQGSTEPFTFLPLRLVGADFIAQDGVQRLQIGNTIYGPAPLGFNHFLQADASN